jgi:hypothetical protein
VTFTFTLLYCSVKIRNLKEEGSYKVLCVCLAFLGLLFFSLASLEK